MSRGRKPAKASYGSDWEGTFKSSVGYYLQAIIVELGSLSVSENGSAPTPRLKPKNALPIIEESEKPFQIPKSWHWYRLGELCSYGSSLKAEPKSLNDSTWVLDLEDIEKESSVLLAKIRFADRASLSTKSVFKRGDVLYSKLRPYLDKVIVADEDGVCTTEILPLSFPDEINPHFLLLTLKLRSFLDYVNGVTKGMKMPRLGTKEGKMALIPLPTLAEQNKILNFLADLESNSLKTEPYFNQTVERKILNLQHSQLKGSEISTELDHQLALVKELRQAYLREAMQGKLVPQDPADEPAEILLEKIKAEKERLVAEKRIKRDKPLPPINPEEIPFEIPSNWTWCRFADIALIESNLVAPSDYPDLPHVAPDNIEKNTGRLLPYKTVLEDEVKSANHYFYPKQLIYSKVRPKLNKVVLVDFEGLCSADMYPIRPFIDSRFLQAGMLSEYFLAEVDRFDNRVKMPKINQNQLSQIPVPVPPLAEQERIVAKLEKLMNIYDELEANIKQGITNAETLLQTALKEALRPTID